VPKAELLPSISPGKASIGQLELAFQGYLLLGRAFCNC
jgi:hypothetical protein